MLAFAHKLGQLILLKNMNPYQIFGLMIVVDMLVFRGHWTYLVLSIFTDSEMVLVIPIAFGAFLQDAFILFGMLFWGILQFLADAFFK